MTDARIKDYVINNQSNIAVTQTGNDIAVNVTGALIPFESTNPAQGTGEWICLVVDTGEPDITAVTYNGTALTSDDVDEAASVGVGAGSFVLWLKADQITTRTITLGTEGKQDTPVTITINR